MLLEYFQMIDRIDLIGNDASILKAHSIVPIKSHVFDEHFPGMPILPSVLLIETMAQASGMLVLAMTDFAYLPLLMGVDYAKMLTAVRPGATLDIEAFLEHEGSGFVVTKAKIISEGKPVCEAQLKLRIMPLCGTPLAPFVRKRAEEVGLTAAMAVNAGCFG